MTLVIAEEHISESCDSNDVITRSRQRRKLHNALHINEGGSNTPDSDGVVITVAATGAKTRKELQTTAAEAGKIH